MREMIHENEFRKTLRSYRQTLYILPAGSWIGFRPKILEEEL